jgi:hypothetical protein
MGLTEEILNRMTPAQRRAYETSLRESRRTAVLAYKLGGGRLNDPPRRRVKRGLITLPSHLDG